GVSGDALEQRELALFGLDQREHKRSTVTLIMNNLTLAPRATPHAVRFWLAVFLAGNPAWKTAAEAASGQSGIVATVQPLATEAAVHALKSGGNAIDAAVAAALTLGVVDGHNSGIGGGCFMLIRLANGSAVALDGRETAPAAATRNMYLR